MSRNLVLCIDGTSDFAAKNSTHVFRLFQSLEHSDQQLVYYDGGIGTLRDATALTLAKQKVLQSLDLAAATSIQRSFGEALRFLVKNYRDGDKIFLFGFSRGAYTVRALAAAIKYFGILYREQENLIPYVWQAFSSIGDHSGGAGADDWADANRMKSAFGRAVRIDFLGAWDTVSSVGLIRLRTLPGTSKLSAVNVVRHAVSIDERRNMFPENLIDRSAQFHQECWFAGVHRDVGGGGASGKLALSMFALHWVVKDALPLGLRLDEERSQHLRSVEPDACGPDNANFAIVALFALAGLVPMRWWTKAGYRWKWLNLWHVRSIPSDASIHDSVRLRMNCPGLHYAPKNLPKSPTYTQTAEPNESGTATKGKPSPEGSS